MYVTRADGTSTGWDFPSYGDWLPHDLCHLVVEEKLGLTDGFWALIGRGVEVGLLNNQATLLRDGRPLGDQPGVDIMGLVEAEAAVAALTGQGRTATPDLVVTAHAETVAAIGGLLEALAAKWRVLEDGGAITLSFSPP